MEIPSLATILQNLSTQVDDLLRLVTALGYFSGFMFAIRSLFFFKQYGETRASGGQANIFKPLINMFVAVVLLYTPSMVSSLENTFFEGIDESSAIAWVQEQSSLYQDSVEALAKILQLVGWVAFIRGWVLLVRIAEQGAQQGTFSKALLYIIGGLLCMNIYATFSILVNTFLTS